MKLFSALMLGLMALPVFAQDIDRNSSAANRFCEQRLSSTNAIQSMITDYRNQLYFTNQGGLFGGGVCWWHSRFTRATNYLAVFDPTLPKPTESEAKKIINNLRSRKGITLIPGYRNLMEFSYDWGREIQNKLSDWQRSDGIFKASWVKGLSGNSQTDATKLSQMMDELYERVSNGEVVYQMLQMPGVTAHAWLVTKMTRMNNGYRLTVIDSNQGTGNYIYSQGATEMTYLDGTRFIPYTGQLEEETKLKEKLLEFCENT